MAQLNEILGPMARLQQRLTRAFAITGSSPSPQLTPEITPVLEMGNMPVEDRWTSREKLWSYQRAIGAAALSVSKALINNPADSGILAIVRAMMNTSAASQNYAVFAGTFANLATFVGGITSCLDSRSGLGLSSKSTCQLSFDQSATAGITTGNELPQILKGYLYISPFEYVLSPGFGLYIEAQIANQADFLGFVWRERPVSEGELLL